MGPLLHNRNLWLLLVADAVSVFGDVLFTVAVMAGVYEARVGRIFQGAAAQVHLRP